MESLDLIARENEFKKLNKQLEKKTEKLMKEIEHVMQKQDFFSEISQNINLGHGDHRKRHQCPTPLHKTPEKSNTPIKSKMKNKIKMEKNTSNFSTPDRNQSEAMECLEIENRAHSKQETIKMEDIVDDKNRSRNIVCDCCSVKNNKGNGDLEFLYAFVSVNVQDNVLPKSFLKDGATVESVCKFFAAKVKLMLEQIDKSQVTIEKKVAQCEKHLTRQAELESERLALLNRANNMKAESAEMRSRCQALQNRLDEKDSQHKALRSEADKLSSEVKRLRSKNAGVEARFASQEHTIDTLKQQLEAAKRAEKEFRDSTRSLSASHQSAISRLDARVKTLTSCVDKQSALIDNLRRQNALLHADGAVKHLENEFNKLLTQDF